MSELRRSSSTLSVVSSIPNEKTVTLEEQQEILRIQKMQHYQNLIKLEQQFNSGNVGQINNQQDAEVNEIVASAESYINQCLNSIFKNDYLFTFSANLDSVSKLNAKKVKLNNADALSENELSKNSSNEPTITLDSVLSLELLRNGLRSGPLAIQLEKIETKTSNQDQLNYNNNNNTNANLAKNNKNENFQLPSLISQLNFKQHSNTKNSLTLKYLLVLDLNRDFFEFSQVSQEDALFSIKLTKRPTKWSMNDYQELTVEVKSTCKEPLSKIVSNILKFKEKTSNSSNNYPKFLNSRAVFDRILKHFVKVLKHEWCIGDNQFSKMVCEDFRWCELKDNQIRSGFKWKGVKQKDLDVILFINLGIKFRHEAVEHKLNQSMLRLLNTFLQNGGFFTKISNLDSFDFVKSWMERNFKVNMSSVYLVPNGVHYWTLLTQPLKLNFIRFLCWINNFTTNSIGNELIVDVLNGRDKSNSAQIKAFVSQVLASQKGHMNKNPSFTTLLNNNSPNCGNLFLLVKSLQLFNFLSLSNNELSARMGNLAQCEEDLLLDLVLAEIDVSRLGNVWSSENIFERLWSCLIRLRTALLTCSMSDQFEVFANALPSCFVNYIGARSLGSLMLLPALSSRLELSGAQQENELKKVIENAMRTLFTGVVTEDNDAIIIQQLHNKHLPNLAELMHKKTPGKNVVNSAEATLGSAINITFSICS